MINLEAPLEVQIRKFWEWWSGELLEITPAPIRKWLERSQQLVLIEVSDQELRCYHFNGSGDRLIETRPLTDCTTDHRAGFIKDHPGFAEMKVAVRLQRSQGLRREIKLPKAAEENLLQVIGLEMDRMTPFTRDQVYFTTKVIDRIKETRQILVRINLTPKTALDESLDQLSQLGWKPDLVFLEGEERPKDFNLIPERFRPKSNKLAEYLNIVLASAILASIILMLALPAWLTRTEVIKVQADLKRTTKVAKEVEAMKEEAEKLLHQAQILQDKKHAEPILVDAIEELTRVIPDDTWLNGLQYSNRRLVIQGQSPSASSLLKQIEGSRFFKGVSFVSPVTKDASNGLERFQIAFDLVNGRFSEEAH